MSNHEWNWQIERRIPTDADAGRGIVEQVLEQLRESDWVEQDVFGIHLAMDEALINAIKHGNQLDRSKSIHIDCRVSQERVYIQIADEGEGFRPDDVPDPTAPENLEEASGRGLMLIRSFMSRVEYNDVGNMVVMEKHRNSSGAKQEQESE